MRNEMINNLPNPDNILMKKLSNGITVLVHENLWSSSAAVCGSVFAGTGLETLDKIGLSSFVSALLPAGTRSRGSRTVSEHLEGIGSTLSFASDPHAIRFTANCLSEDLPNLLRMLKEIMDEPAFPESDFEVLRRQVLAGYVQDDNVPDEAVHKLFKELLWGKNHPYGRLKRGSDEIIRSITRDDLVDFHRRYFGPKNCILSLAGGFRGREIMDRCEEIFGSWKKTQEETDEDALFPHVEPDEEITRVHMNFPDKEEISLVIGTFGPKDSDSDSLSAKIGNNILGEFGSMGRLGLTIRDENGLAYDIFSELDSMKKGGSWYVSAGVAPANLTKAIDMILEELRRFTAEPVSMQELDETKSWWISSLPLVFVTNSGKAARIHDLALYQRGFDYYLRLPALVNAITPETILETSRKWIDPKRVVITTTGPWDESVRTEIR